MWPRWFSAQKYFYYYFYFKKIFASQREINIIFRFRPLKLYKVISFNWRSEEIVDLHTNIVYYCTIPGSLKQIPLLAIFRLFIKLSDINRFLLNSTTKKFYVFHQCFCTINTFNRKQANSNIYKRYKIQTPECTKVKCINAGSAIKRIFMVEWWKGKNGIKILVSEASWFAMLCIDFEICK